MTLILSSHRYRSHGRARPARTTRVATALVGILVYAVLASPLQAQFGAFGKNKVQYTHFDWRVLSGDHVDVFFYPEEEELAQVALAYAEESFDTLVALFRHEPFRRVPLIIYSSHQHFEQTNVTPAFIPEGVAGFTEYLKRRIAMPFNGNYTDFRHTIRHELVHFFQISKLSRVLSQFPGSRGVGLPLWWSEGLAEHWSSEQDADDDMFVRDLVLSGRMPDANALNFSRSFIAYPFGGELHKYLAERFGSGRVTDLYESLWKYSSFDEAFAGVYGVPFQRVLQDLRYELEREYFRQFEDRKPVDLDAVAIVKGLPAFKPAAYTTPEGGEEVYFMSPGTGYTTIYKVSLADGRRQKVVQGEHTEDFESFHFFYSRFDVGSDGKLVVVSKYLGKDALFIYDPGQSRIVGRYQFPELVALQSPAWSNDGLKVVFSGLATSGFSNLYVLDLTTQEHYPLTADRYEEADPDWSPDGRYIVFSSDRTVLGARGYSNLFLYDMETGEITYLTYGPWRDVDPRWSPDGERIVFTSSRNDIYDLYVVDPDGRGGRLTSYTGAVFDADWVAEGRSLVFSAFEEGTYRIYYESLTSEEDPELKLVDTFEPPEFPSEQGWLWRELEGPVVSAAASTRYKPSFGFDIATGGAMVSQFGAAQAVQVVMSDMLGNHMIFGGIAALQTSSFNDALNSLSGRVMYLNLSHRVNWGVGIFRVKGRFVDAAFRNTYEENAFGASFLASYPFSKFRRIDLRTGIAHSDREDSFSIVRFGDVNPSIDTLSLTRKGIISQTSLSYVMDNTLWLPVGPIDGLRWNITGGLVTDLTHARAENFQIMFDLRRYFRTSLLSAYSVRMFAFWSDGAIPQRVPLGGSYSLRLYPYLGLFGSRIWMVNQEWRFPLAHAIALAFPFGTMRFPGVQGAVFLDMAQVWREDQDPEGVWGSWGFGFRMPLFSPLILRLDMGRRFKIGDLPTFTFRDFDGWTVDFFIGVNY